MVLPFVAMAQQKNWDTTRYQKYHANLILGTFQAYRNFNNEFTPVSSTDSTRFASNYMAESTITSGIEINYDKIGLCIGLRTKPQENSAGKGYTRTFCLGFNAGGNEWFLETAYRSFRGFYDVNTARYDTSFRHTGKYALQPDFTNKLFRTKFFYFFNHKKYSFRSNYVCNYRQLRTGGTWLLSANTNHNYLHNDSSFFPAPARKFYLDQAQLNTLGVFGLSVNGGGAFTIVVWKAMFLHFMFMTGPEQQFRTYRYSDRPTKHISYLSLSGDFRASFGFNWKRAYMVWSAVNDYVFYNNAVMTLQNRSIGGSFMMGWRFNVETPENYKKFQNTKLYSNL